jgi:hypothetical protein
MTRVSRSSPASGRVIAFSTAFDTAYAGVPPVISLMEPDSPLTLVIRGYRLPATGYR